MYECVRACVPSGVFLSERAHGSARVWRGGENRGKCESVLGERGNIVITTHYYRILRGCYPLSPRIYRAIRRYRSFLPLTPKRPHPLHLRDSNAPIENTIPFLTTPPPPVAIVIKVPRQMCQLEEADEEWTFSKTIGTRLKSFDNSVKRG